MRRRLWSTGAVLLAGVLPLAACAGDPEASPSAEQTETPAEESPTETTEPSEPEPTTTDGELPGEAFESGPAEGAELAVVGVSVDDTLAVRSGPGTEYEAVTQVAPLGTAVATGQSRMIENAGIWTELTSDGDTGWANMRYLGYLGATNDITSELPAFPAGRDLRELVGLVATARSGGGSADVDIVVVDGPHHGDLGEITADMTGFEDDSVLGARLHLFAQADGDGYTVKSVEETLLCSRGVTDDGLCL